MTMDIGKTSRFTRDERCRGKREDYEKRGKNTPGMSYPLHRFPPADTEADCGGYNGISIPLFRTPEGQELVPILDAYRCLFGVVPSSLFQPAVLLVEHLDLVPVEVDHLNLFERLEVVLRRPPGEVALKIGVPALLSEKALSLLDSSRELEDAEEPSGDEIDLPASASGLENVLEAIQRTDLEYRRERTFLFSRERDYLVHLLDEFLFHTSMPCLESNVQERHMKRIVLSACITLITISTLYAEGARGRSNRDVDLVLYSLAGISGFAIDGANKDPRFDDVESYLKTANVGAGFFLQMGDRFAYGADYLYGQSRDFRILESPVFVQYAVASLGPVSIAPQVGLTFGNAQISSFDSGNGDRNATIITSDYLIGRLGVGVNMSFGNGIFLGLKSGYNLPLFPDEDWSVPRSGEDFGRGDRLGQNHAAVVALLLMVLPAVAAQSRSPEFTLQLEPSPHYSYRSRQTIMGFLPIRYTVQPQAAIWLETTDGRYIATLCITDRVEQQNRKLAPEECRPKALPVWSHTDHASVDAVASATPKGATDHTVTLSDPLAPGDYVIKLETNRSYDFNQAYPESNAIIDQPSLVYAAELRLDGRTPATAAFRVIGTGSPTGSDGRIRPRTEGITTALELFASLSISYAP
jgi:hypothetical protein